MNKPWFWGDAIKPFAYDLIVADPPWFFEAWTLDGHNSKGAGGHYDLMRLEDIMAMPVGEIAGGDCLLLMWTTGWAMAEGQAQRVARAWGFKPVTEIVWHKTTPGEKTRMGTGYRVRSMHEPILVCTIGNPQHRALPSYFRGIAREHSRKPDELNQIVNRCCPLLSRRLDLFPSHVGEPKPGYDRWGKPHRIALTDAAESAHHENASPASGVNSPPERRGLIHPTATLGDHHGSLFDDITPS